VREDATFRDIGVKVNGGNRNQSITPWQLAQRVEHIAL
jgi:hypothetical protein